MYTLNQRRRNRWKTKYLEAWKGLNATFGYVTKWYRRVHEDVVNMEDEVLEQLRAGRRAMRTDEKNKSGPQQHRMYYGAVSATTERWRTFMEIQESGNPLSEDEIRLLIEKRPGVYAFLKAYAGG